MLQDHLGLAASKSSLMRRTSWDSGLRSCKKLGVGHGEQCSGGSIAEALVHAAEALYLWHT